MGQIKAVKPQSKTHILKIVAVVVAFIMWGGNTLYEFLYIAKHFHVNGIRTITFWFDSSQY